MKEQKTEGVSVTISANAEVAIEEMNKLNRCLEHTIELIEEIKSYKLFETV